MQAIKVEWKGPTNTKGARYVATCASGRFTMPDPYLGWEIGARAAAEALRTKMQWHESFYGRLEMGVLPDGNYVFVFVK